MNLNDLQLKLRDAILNNDISSDLLSHIRSTNTLNVNDRLAIYRGSTLGGFNKALSISYPVCEKLVGELFFGAMTSHFIKEHPAHSPETTDYGYDFANFIEEFPPASSLPYLPDVARLERACEFSENTVEMPTLNFDALKEARLTNADNIIFHLPKSASLLQSAYPILSIWKANQEDSNNDEEISLDEGQDQLIIYKKASRLCVDKLDNDQWTFLNIINNAPFTTVCKTLETHYPNMNIISLLPQAIEQGWIESFSVQRDCCKLKIN